MLRDKGPQDFVYEECNNLGKMNFEFADKSSPMRTCVHYAGRMQLFDESNMGDIISSQYISNEFNKEKCQKIAEMLCDPERLNIFVRSQSFKEAATEKAEWYDTSYLCEDFSAELLKKIKEPKCEIKTKKIDLPPPNNLIP